MNLRTSTIKHFAILAISFLTITSIGGFSKSLNKTINQTAQENADAGQISEIQNLLYRNTLITKLDMALGREMNLFGEED